MLCCCSVSCLLTKLVWPSLLPPTQLSPTAFTAGTDGFLKTKDLIFSPSLSRSAQHCHRFSVHKYNLTQKYLPILFSLKFKIFNILNVKLDNTYVSIRIITLKSKISLVIAVFLLLIIFNFCIPKLNYKLMFLISC